MSDPGAPELAGRVRANLAAVATRIAAAAPDPSTVRVVAVTKGFGPEAVRAALAAGLGDVGESYAQEMVAKVAALDAPAPGGLRPVWHFIGRLQRNKVRAVAPHVGLWQSVDRLELGVEIARRAPGAAVLVQVDVSGEPAKGGCLPEGVPALVRSLGELGLDVRGLMAVGPTGPPEAARPGFRRVAELGGELGLPERSMGMSGDLEVALEEGATMVRIGTALLGARPSRGTPR